jgi:hypothetical protein
MDPPICCPSALHALQTPDPILGCLRTWADVHSSCHAPCSSSPLLPRTVHPFIPPAKHRAPLHPSCRALCSPSPLLQRTVLPVTPPATCRGPLHPSCHAPRSPSPLLPRAVLPFTPPATPGGPHRPSCHVTCSPSQLLPRAALPSTPPAHGSALCTLEPWTPDPRLGCLRKWADVLPSRQDQASPDRAAAVAPAVLHTRGRAANQSRQVLYIQWITGSVLPLC